MEKVISGRLRKPRNIADRISISINLKMESQLYQGINSDYFKTRYLNTSRVFLVVRVSKQGLDSGLELLYFSISFMSSSSLFGFKGFMDFVSLMFIGLARKFYVKVMQWNNNGFLVYWYGVYSELLVILVSIFGSCSIIKYGNSGNLFRNTSVFCIVLKDTNQGILISDCGQWLWWVSLNQTKTKSYRYIMYMLQLILKQEQMEDAGITDWKTRPLRYDIWVWKISGVTLVQYRAWEEIYFGFLRSY